MALGSLNPTPVQQWFDSAGRPLAGGTLAFYQAGTSTPLPVYADWQLTTPLSNPVVLDAGGRTPEVFLSGSPYKEVLKDALNNTVWTADNIVPPTALRGVVQTITLTGLQHDVPVAPGLVTFLSCNNTAPLTIDGFAGGTPGQILILRAGSAAPVYLNTGGGGSGSQTQNQLSNWLYSGPTPLASVSGTATYIYSGANWVLIAHEQGQWLSVPYSAANFVSQDGSGNPLGTWTVTAGNVTAQQYYLRGTTLLMTATIAGSTVAGSPIYLVMGGWPYSWSAGPFPAPAVRSPGAVQYGIAVVSAQSAQNYLRIARDDVAAWASGTTGVSLQCSAGVN
jgi:hypothetical protein